MLKFLYEFNQLVYLNENENIKKDIINGEKVKYILDERKVEILDIENIDNIDNYPEEEIEEIEKEIQDKHDDSFLNDLLSYYGGEDWWKHGITVTSAKYFEIGYITLRISSHSASSKHQGYYEISFVTHRFDETKNKGFTLEATNYDISDLSLNEAIDKINETIKYYFEKTYEEKLEDSDSIDEIEGIFQTIEEIITNYGGNESWFKKFSNPIKEYLNSKIEDDIIDEEDYENLKEKYNFL